MKDMDRRLSAAAVAWCLVAAVATLRAQESPESPAALEPDPTPMADRPTVGLDPRHPPKIGAEYYPKESLRRKEQGTALVRLYTAPDGSVPASQVVVSSGFARLDEASLTAWVDAKVRPAILHGEAIHKWINVPTQWTINQPRGWGLLDPSLTPQMPDDYQPELGQGHYPKAALDMRQEGTCLVHFRVSEGGTPDNISITKSTGFATLDQACISAVQNAQFISARRAGKYASAWTEILISWHLPSSQAPP
jgi:TonB family protein